ncbi:MAG: hypothetical protein ACKVG0_08185 [Alphaproteobacteria bacterium]|jgi:hypothetical protein
MSGQRGKQDHSRSAQKHFAQKNKRDSFTQELEKARVAQLEKTERLCALRLAKEASDIAGVAEAAK